LEKEKGGSRAGRLERWGRNDERRRVFCVSFTSMTTVIKMLMLTSIDRLEGVFIQESIIKFTRQGTDPYFVLQTPSATFLLPSAPRGET